MHDVIIVGARCAGASAALLLARKGHRVLLVDRARLPGDIPHGHMIHKDGPQRLRRWSLLDRIVEAGTPPIQAVSTYFGDFVLTARDLVVDGVAWGYGPRRRVVDGILLDAAATGFPAGVLSQSRSQTTSCVGTSSRPMIIRRISRWHGWPRRRQKLWPCVRRCATIQRRRPGSGWLGRE